MASIWHVTWEWDGIEGAPGFTNLFYASSTGDAPEALAAVTKSKLLFFNLLGMLPSGCSIAPVTDVRLVDDATGDLLNIFTVTGVTGVTGSGSSTYAGPVGGCIDWLTTTVHGGRRMQGRTFVVPMASSQYENNGTLVSGAVAAMATAAETMRTASGPTFGVWGRPRAAKPLATPPVTARAGLWGPAVSSRVPDKAVVLRSRRD
jgi:hypothetical protein